jgi:enoyl-CoA hydratase
MGQSGDGDQVLLTELIDGVLILTLNRDQARNALSLRLIHALNEALTRLEYDDTVHAGVITGAGKAFCAGLDLETFAAADADRKPAGALIRRVGRLRKPLVGAVNGPTIAGGLELALGCDFLIGSPAAMFADTHRTVGAFPGGGLTARLPHAVGVRTAKAMSLGGMRLNAHAALRAGLLSEVVDADALVCRARELASNIAAADPTYIQALRELYDANMDRSLADALAAEQTEKARWGTSHPDQPWNTDSRVTT